MPIDKLNDAISKAKSGDRGTAGKLLAEYVRENPSNEIAWLWLSVCVNSVDKKRFCLNKALAINPNNENAQKALAQLDSPPPSAPSFSELSSSQSASRPVQVPQNQSYLPSTSSQTKLLAVPMEQVGEYVRSILLPNESVLAIGKIHWVIYVAPTIFLVLALIGSIISLVPAISLSSVGAVNNNEEGLLFVAAYFMICGFPFWIIAGYGFFKAYLTTKFTEFALTDKRVIGKSGLIRRRSLELVLGKIESISVNQSLMGRVLNFGTLVVSGSGGTHQPIPYIADPMRMKQKINSILAE